MKRAKKIKREIRSTDKSWRWSRCLKLATLAYHSTLNSHQIDENIELIADQFQRVER